MTAHFQAPRSYASFNGDTATSLFSARSLDSTDPIVRQSHLSDQIASLRDEIDLARQEGGCSHLPCHPDDIEAHYPFIQLAREGSITYLSDHLEDSLANLENRMESRLSASLAPVYTGMAALKQSVAAVERRVASLEMDSGAEKKRRAALSGQMQSIFKKFKKLKGQTANPGLGLEGQVTELDYRVTGMEREVQMGFVQMMVRSFTLEARLERLEEGKVVDAEVEDDDESMSDEIMRRFIAGLDEADDTSLVMSDIQEEDDEREEDDEEEQAGEEQESEKGQEQGEEEGGDEAGEGDDEDDEAEEGEDEGDIDEEDSAAIQPRFLSPIRLSPSPPLPRRMATRSTQHRYTPYSRQRK